MKVLGVVVAGCVLAAVGITIIAPPVRAQLNPDPSKCYYVPESGSVSSPVTGLSALVNFRVCPNNEGGQSLPNNARIRVVVLAFDGSPIVGYSAANISALFNGGTQAQGFTGVGSDSIIANSTWNSTCPDMHPVGFTADAPTDSSGVAYITFTGATAGSPGVGTRDASRKWGHYDTLIPVFINGNFIYGRLTVASAPGSFSLQIKNFDSVGGLDAVSNQGEKVNSLDINPVQSEITAHTYAYWHDFDWNGTLNSLDLNLVTAHNNHNCTAPRNP